MLGFLRQPNLHGISTMRNACKLDDVRQPLKTGDLETAARLASIHEMKSLPKFGKTHSLFCMTTMNISVPETLKSFVEDQVQTRGYGTSSEYVRELIRKDQDCQYVRGLLLAGAESPPTTTVDKEYFDALRARVRANTT